MRKTLYKLIFILTCCTFNSLSYAQAYKSVFGQDTTQWNVRIFIPEYMPTYIFRTFNDTVLNQNKYKILHRGNEKMVGDIYCYLREDTLTGKIWALPFDLGNEILIMDLSLTKTDTFKFNTTNIYKADSVYHVNGVKTITFNSGQPDSLKFIEGVGPSSFLSYGIGNLSGRDILRCKFNDDSLVYHNLNYIDCVDSVLSIKENRLTTISISPNPATNQLHVQQAKASWQYEIIGIDGRSIHAGTFATSSEVPVSFLKPGIYFIRITEDEKPVGVVKFVKE